MDREKPCQHQTGVRTDFGQHMARISPEVSSERGMGALPDFIIDDYDYIPSESEMLFVVATDQDVSFKSTEQCEAELPTYPNANYLLQMNETDGLHSMPDCERNSTLSCYDTQSTPPFPTPNGVPTPPHSKGTEVFVNIQTMPETPSQETKAYSPAICDESKYLDDIMEIVNRDMQENETEKSKVWNNPTITIEQTPKGKEHHGVQLSSVRSVSKIFQADVPEIKNCDPNMSAPTVNSDVPHAKGGTHSRKRENVEDKAFMEGCLYEKKAKTLQMLNPKDMRPVSPPAPCQSVGLSRSQHQLRTTGTANTIVHTGVESAPAANGSPRMSGSSGAQCSAGIPSASSINCTSVSHQETRMVQNCEMVFHPGVSQQIPHIVSAAEPHQARLGVPFQPSLGSDCTHISQGSSHEWPRGEAAVHGHQAYGAPSLDLPTNSLLQQSSHFCATALSQTTMTQNGNPSHQPFAVPAMQQQDSYHTWRSTIGANVTPPQPANVPQEALLICPDQVYSVPEATYAASVSSQTVGSVLSTDPLPPPRSDLGTVAPSAPVDPTRLGIVSHAYAQSSSNFTRIMPGCQRENEKEKRVRSFNQNPFLLMSCHQMIGPLAQSGFFLTRGNMIQCVDKTCSLMHLLPNVLDKISSEVKWHERHCRFFLERRPCKYCVGSSTQRIECARCGRSSQTERTF